MYEGRPLAPEELGLGRGWANATRTGRDVTEEILEQPSAVEAFKASLPGRISLPDLLAAAGRRYPGARASERLALAERVSENFRDYHVLARRDEHNVERLARELPVRPVLVPHFDDDVHDVDGLLRVHRYLFAAESERARLIADVVA